MLILAFRKYWRILNYVSFILTWGLFLSWYGDRFNYEEHFSIALIFSAVFFFTFYGVLLAYKLIHQEQYALRDVVFLLINSFLYFGAGYHIIEQIPQGEKWLGLFTICNAIVHLGVALLIRQRKAADKNLFYLVAGLVLTFLTLTFPIQLNGNWVTLIWIAEAVLVFWIGRSQKVFFYESLAYILAGMSFFSLIHDWSEGYAHSVYSAEGISLIPIFNIQFLTSFMVVAGLAAILWLNHKYGEPEIENKWIWINKLGNIAVPAFLLISLFFAFWEEMSQYSFQQIAQTALEIDGVRFFNHQIGQIREIWQMNYALVFFTVLLFLNDRFWKSSALRYSGLIFTGLFLVIFLSEGLNTLADLRTNYLFGQDEHFTLRSAGIWMRYVSYIVIGFALKVSFDSLKLNHSDARFFEYSRLIIHFVILVLLSNELLNLSDIFYNPENDYALTMNVKRVGYSVLWGVYSLFLIGLGLWRKHKILRLGGIGLFGVTLAKVFLFDLSETSVANKTVIFLALGVLLLVVSFLYQKYKHIILGEEEEEKPVLESEEKHYE